MLHISAGTNATAMLIFFWWSQFFSQVASRPGWKMAFFFSEIFRSFSFWVCSDVEHQVFSSFS